MSKRRITLIEEGDGDVVSPYVTLSNEERAEQIVQFYDPLDVTPDYNFRILSQDLLGNAIVVHDEADTSRIADGSFEVRLPGARFNLAVEIYNYAAGTPTLTAVVG